MVTDRTHFVTADAENIVCRKQRMPHGKKSYM